MKSTPTRGVKETLKPNAYNQSEPRLQIALAIWWRAFGFGAPARRATKLHPRFGFEIGATRECRADLEVPAANRVSDLVAG